MIPLWAHYVLSTISFVLTLLFVSAILRAKRAPGSMLAWLLLIVIIPYVGIPIYLMFSDRKFGLGLATKPKLNPMSGRSKTPSELSQTQRILYASNMPSAKMNYRIALLPTGVGAYDKIVELIGEARESIFLTTFIFGNDEVGRGIVELLEKKAAAGIDVRILVDSLGATLIRHPSFREFTKAGGHLAYFMPILHIPLKGRTNLRNHRKMMIVDTKKAVVGGMNLANEYLGPVKDPTRWVDLALELEGKCVIDLAEIFMRDWAFANRKNETVRLPDFSRVVEGRSLAQIVASGPDVVGDPLYDILLSAIHGAKQSIYIVTPYFIPDESLNKALEIAVKRGVVVRVIVPQKSNHRLADLARGSFVRGLKGVGVEFGFFPRMIHAKAVMIDQTLAVLGSANFDMRSLLLNYELGLVIYSSQDLQNMQSWFADTYSHTTTDLKTAGFWQNLAEGMGRVFGPMI